MRTWRLILLAPVLTACGPTEVTGYVRDPRGAGVAGAVVSIWRVGGRGSARGRTDASGRFSVTYRGGRERVIVQACHPGYAIVQDSWATLRQIPDTIVLQLRDAASLAVAAGC